MTPQPLYTITELTEHVGRPVSFIRNAIRKGLLSCHQDAPGATIHVTLTQWNEYLEATSSIAKKSKNGGVRLRPKTGTRGRKSKSRRDPASYSGLAF